MADDKQESRDGILDVSEMSIDEIARKLSSEDVGNALDLILKSGVMEGSHGFNNAI